MAFANYIRYDSILVLLLRLGDHGRYVAKEHANHNFIMPSDLLYPALISMAGILLVILWAAIQVSLEKLSLPNAASCGEIDRLERLLKRQVRPTQISEALYCAVFHRRDQALDVLIEHGADPDSVIAQWEGTPLHVAARYGTEYAITRLVVLLIVSIATRKEHHCFGLPTKAILNM